MGGCVAALLGTLLVAALLGAGLLRSCSGGRRFELLWGNVRARAFLDGAGPAAIGAILGAAVTLAGALREDWRFAWLAVAALLLLVLRRGVVEVLVGAGALGVMAALAGAPLPG